MKKEVVIALVIGLVVGFVVGTQINRYKVEASGGEYPRSIKVDRLTGESWILSSEGWYKIKETR
jgi:hypothetical protein